MSTFIRRTEPTGIPSPLWPLHIGMAVVSLALLLSNACASQGGTAPESDTPLPFGMSTALSGPAASLGINMRTGVLTAFAEANQLGGIHGQTLRLIALDDGYEPDRTAANMHQLAEKDQVLAIIGNVGTPTAIVAVPLVNEYKVPLIGAYTGAGVLRKSPPDRYVINYRASYAEETSAMVDALIEFTGIQPEEIAFFTQRDAYGDAGYFGGLSALKRHGLAEGAPVAHGRYERNTLAVENGLADILFHEPAAKAVIMVGAYAPCAEFIRLSRENALNALLLNVSFVGAEPLRDALGDTGDGTIITQVVPHFDSDLPIVKAYRLALHAFDPSARPTFGSLEGYIVARMMLQALGEAEETLTREGIVNALEGLGEFDLGLETPLRLGPGEHQASHTLWPTVLRGGKVIPFDWRNLAIPLSGD